MRSTRDRCRDGMTLMEVLASIFVISIGLLGVLAVIPFGAFQVSKGRNAEHTSNMLAAAGQDVKIMGLAKPETWKFPMGGTLQCTVQSNAQTGTNYVYVRNDANAIPGNKRLDCRRFLMVDPFDTSTNDPFNNNFNCFYKIGRDLASSLNWQEIMRGQDDLVFTTHKDKRTDFSGQSNQVASSGKYTWFMTFAPPSALSNTTNIRNGLVDTALLTQTVNVDLLGCYNRMPGDGDSEREVTIAGYTQTFKGAQVTLQGTNEELDLSKTKYIFIVWDNGSSTDKFQYSGIWCKIAYAPKNVDSNSQKTIVVSGDDLPASLPASRKAIIIDGILYHKPLGDISLFN